MRREEERRKGGVTGREGEMKWCESERKREWRKGEINERGNESKGQWRKGDGNGCKRSYIVIKIQPTLALKMDIMIISDPMSSFKPYLTWPNFTELYFNKDDNIHKSKAL